MREVLWLIVAVVLVISAGIARFAVRGTRRLGTATQRASYETLHTANLAAPALRTGFHAEAVRRALPHLRSLLGTEGVVVADVEGILGADRVDSQHGTLIAPAMDAAISSGRPRMLTGKDLSCGDPLCPYQAGVVVPLHVGPHVVGALAALDGADAAAAGLLRRKHSDPRVTRTS